MLHTLVVIADDTTDNTDMIAGIYDQILIQHFRSEAKTVPLEAIENNQGLTPLKLAAKLGKIGVCLISTQRLFCSCKPGGSHIHHPQLTLFGSCLGWWNQPSSVASIHMVIFLLFPPSVSWTAVSAHPPSGNHGCEDEVAVQEVYRVGIRPGPLLAVRHRLHRHGPTEFGAGNRHLWE